MVEILKLGLVKISKFKFCGDADVWLRFFVDVSDEDCVGNRLLQILKLRFGQYFAADAWLRL